MDNTFSLPPYKVYPICSLEEVIKTVSWEISKFNLPESWKHTQGEGVKVALLDTGCDLNHDELKENLLPGINFVQPGTPPQDDGVHGTHCTGIICGTNSKRGVVGIAPKCKVIPVKVLDAKGNGDLETVAKGIYWAADNGADIISMSLGCPMPVDEVHEAIIYADKKGIPIFCAAGNAGNTKQVFYPSYYDECIAIGSIDENLDRSSFSNTGDQLDFMAPGGKIFSTVPPNWYATLSGTSMACPAAAAMAALFLSHVRKHGDKISLNGSKDYIEALKKYTTSINDPITDKFFQGFGIIDPRKLDEWLNIDDPIANP